MNQDTPKTKAAGKGSFRGNTNDIVNDAGVSASAQCARTLSALRKRPHTTLELRGLQDVLHPAARVMELRERGEPIQTMWTTDHTSEGKPHRVARYVLMTGAAQ